MLGDKEQQPASHFLQELITKSDKLDNRFRLAERLGLSAEERLFALAFLQKRLLRARIYEISTFLKGPETLVIKRIPLIRRLPEEVDRLNEQNKQRLSQLEEAIEISIAMNLMGFTLSSEVLKEIKEGGTELAKDYLTDLGMKKIHTIRTIELAINDLFAQATYQNQPEARKIKFNPDEELLVKWAERWRKELSNPTGNNT